MEELILDLHSCECIQFGKFTLKSKVVSPIYIDFKAVVSYPKIVSNIVDKFIRKIECINPDFKSICGVPYGGIVFSSLISNKLNVPMLIVRKEVKKYGMKSLTWKAMLVLFTTSVLFLSYSYYIDHPHPVSQQQNIFCQQELYIEVQFQPNEILRPYA